MAVSKHYTKDVGFMRRLQFVNAAREDAERLLNKGGCDARYKNLALERMAKAICSDEVGYLTLREIDYQFLMLDIAGAKDAAEPVSKKVAYLKRDIDAVRRKTKATKAVR
jgi:hypothetical protein